MNHAAKPAVAILPAQPHWAILIEIRAAGEPLDYYAEPILAWHIDVEGAATPVTLRGPATACPIMRPDESVRFNDVDYPDFAAFLLAMRGDSWAAGEDPGEVRLGKDGEPIRPVIVP
jgi:hypothetical protein